MQLRSDLTSDLKSMAQMSFDPIFILVVLSSVGPLSDLDFSYQMFDGRYSYSSQLVF